MPSQKSSSILSKSTFIRGLQCEKSLYLHKKRPFLRDRISPEQLAKFSRGTNVGVYAQQLFPGGVNAAPKTHFQMAASVKKTAEFMEAGETVIYEAAFEHAGVIIALDILVKNEKGWHAIEVKSSKAISETYLWDASLQYFVMAGSGVQVSDFSIAYINTSFVRKGPINPAELFKIESVLPVALERQEQVGQKIERLKEVVELKSSPPIPIGSHCHNPYPCDFIGHCWKNLPAGSVFDLKGLEEDQKFRYFESGIINVSDIPEKELDEKTTARQVKSMAMGQAVVDSKDLKAFLDRIKMPAAVFSWLDFKPAIPIFEGTKPYQPVIFSFAINRVTESGAEPLVFTSAGFPEREMLERLVSEMQNYGSILLYGQATLNGFLPGAEKLQEVLNKKGIDVSAPFNDYTIAWPGMRHKDTPSDVLAAFRQRVALPAGKIKSPLEAALAIENLAAHNGMGSENTIIDIDALQRANLQNLQGLWYLLHDLCKSEGGH